MAKGVGIEVKGLEEIQNYLKKVGKNLVSRETMGQSALKMLRDVNDHFVKTQGFNKKWDSLKIRSGRPLQKTGRLKNSIVSSWNNKSAVVGTNLKYARIHDKGGIIRPKQAKRLFIPLSSRAARKRPGAPIPKGYKWGKDFVFAKKAKIPARPFMWISKWGVDQIFKVFTRLLQKS
jgi:phage gpG-like protein